MPRKPLSKYGVLTMRIEQIKGLAIGAAVGCPPDMGEPSYTGHVDAIGETVTYNRARVPFVWVSVRTPTGRVSIWPSNRLAVA